MLLSCLKIKMCSPFPIPHRPPAPTAARKVAQAHDNGAWCGASNSKSGISGLYLSLPSRYHSRAKNARHFQMTLHAHKFKPAIKLIKIGRNGQIGSTRFFPIANDQIQHKFFFPLNKRIAQQRHQIVADCPIKRVLEIQHPTRLPVNIKLRTIKSRCTYTFGCASITGNNAAMPCSHNCFV